MTGKYSVGDIVLKPEIRVGWAENGRIDYAAYLAGGGCCTFPDGTRAHPEFDGWNYRVDDMWYPEWSLITTTPKNHPDSRDIKEVHDRINYLRQEYIKSGKAVAGTDHSLRCLLTDEGSLSKIWLTEAEDAAWEDL